MGIKLFSVSLGSPSNFLFDSPHFTDEGSSYLFQGSFQIIDDAALRSIRFARAFACGGPVARRDHLGSNDQC